MKPAPLATKTAILRSLGNLVRGLSAVFWGIPLALVIGVQTALTDWFRSMEELGILLPIGAHLLIFTGLKKLSLFQLQERIWIRSLERAEILVWINIGLCPFLYWWNRFPQEELFVYATGMMGLSSLTLLFNINMVLQRLTAMLPDRLLGQEVRLFTTFNGALLVLLISSIAFFAAVKQMSEIPVELVPFLAIWREIRQFFILFLILLPVSVTMALIWKIKEIIFESVFTMEVREIPDVHETSFQHNPKPPLDFIPRNN
ncbi:MAG TPA: hypothetical protein EYQ50_07515 [Verrucomicrobiales bacterium]|nr:hypothetical protein [Verrucomicrobiales bacterium]HIL70877.1 hypothetical protein [Verrucomicrobiota bacterium]